MPGALVLVVGGLLASYLFDLGDHGVALVGDVPRGLPSFEVPDTSADGTTPATVAVAAVALVLIGFSQTAGDARAFAAKHRYQIDVDQESVAQSVANIGAGVFQGMPVSTSLSASSLNDHSGARTGLASITSGVTVLLTLLVLAPLFSRPAQAGARRADHRGRRDGHDGPAGDAADVPGPAVRLLDRDRRHRRARSCSACSPA